MEDIERGGLPFDPDRLHTTALGVSRIQRNLALNVDDVVGWCRGVMSQPGVSAVRHGKNWMVRAEDCVFTI